MSSADDTIEQDIIDTPTSAGIGGGPVRGASERGTLDESVYETFKRDVVDINTRLKQVVYPHFWICCRYTSVEAEQDVHCDLWAPLTFILIYTISVSRSDTAALFSTVFVSLWAILLIMALHLRLTKIQDSNSLLSNISISGYCLFPMVINNLLSQVLLPLVFHDLGNALIYRIYTSLRLVILGGALFWSIAAIRYVTKSDTFIQTYPLVLCFLGIGWLSIIS